MRPRETPARLRQYYFKNDVYDRVVADLPLRILVGHKGVGKSALFKVAISESQEAGDFPVLIRPDESVRFDDLAKITVAASEAGLMPALAVRTAKAGSVTP